LYITFFFHSITSSYHQAKSQPSVINSSSANLPNATPNKSSLFNQQKIQPNIAVAPVPPQGIIIWISYKLKINIKIIDYLGPPKVNYGKPNLAPKPPAQLSLVNNNSDTSDVNRKSVARHQSMKSPRYIDAY
jgi:hypothetical protein